MSLTVYASNLVFLAFVARYWWLLGRISGPLVVRRGYCGLLVFLKNLGEGAACPQRVIGALISGGESVEILRFLEDFRNFWNFRKFSEILVTPGED